MVFHGKLRAFCAFLAEEARRQGQGKVDARRHARASHTITVHHDALAHRHRAEIGKLIERKPMAGGAITGEEPGTSQNERSGANRGHIAGAARLPAQKGENLFIFHERDLPRSAGDEKNVRLWAISESARGQQPQAARIGDASRFFQTRCRVNSSNRASTSYGPVRSSWVIRG